jgi:hypothetical protein
LSRAAALPVGPIASARATSVETATAAASTAKAATSGTAAWAAPSAESYATRTTASWSTWALRAAKDGWCALATARNSVAAKLRHAGTRERFLLHRDILYAPAYASIYYERGIRSFPSRGLLWLSRVERG